MLRFHKFTAGRFWVDDAMARRTIPRSSRPSTLIRRTTTSRMAWRHPATLVTMADTDDRVVPGHSFKFAARLQAAQSGRRRCSCGSRPAATVRASRPRWPSRKSPTNGRFWSRSWRFRSTERLVQTRGEVAGSRQRTKRCRRRRSHSPSSSSASFFIIAVAGPSSSV